MPTLEIEDVTLHYEVYNEREMTGAPVLLLHGLGSRGEDWGLQVEALSPRYRIIAPDLRAQGRSVLHRGGLSVTDLAGDVIALLATRREPPAHVVGLSLGGLVALQLAVDRPDQVRSLTVVNACARLPRSRLGLRQGLVRSWLALTGQTERMAALIAQGLFPRAEQREFRELAAARIGSNPGLTYFRLMWGIARFDLCSRVARIRVPTLIIAGEQDTTVPLEAKRDLAGRVAGARLEVIPQSGHVTPVDSAGPFNALLLDFLGGVDQPGTGVPGEHRG